MKEFPLGGGLVAKVDDEDWEMLIQHRWHPRRCRRKTVADTWYATTNITLPDGTRAKIDMHRMILDVPLGMQVDHIDHDGLNNQRTTCESAPLRRMFAIDSGAAKVDFRRASFWSEKTNMEPRFIMTVASTTTGSITRLSKTPQRRITSSP